MEEKKLAPKLRFPQFADDWEQREFGEVIARSSDVSSEFDLPRVEYEDIISGLGLLNKDIRKKISYKTGLVFHSGDVLYGKLRPYLKNWLLPTFSGIAVGDFWVLKSQELDSSFVYRLIQTNQFDEIANQSTGTKMPRADWKLVSKSLFYVPTNVLEQVQIGQLFLTLDNFITLYQRKYEQYKQLKASMLEKMFPKDGETIPEIRFPEFEGEWSQLSLGKLGYTYTGLSGKSKEDFGHGEGQYITYLNVFANPTTSLSGVESIEIDESQNKVQKGDVFFTTSSETPDEVGMSSVLLEDIEDTYLNSFCFGFRPTCPIDSLYLAYVLRSETFRNKTYALAQGVSRYNISKNRVMEIEIPIPTLKEQERIGSFFNALENLITLHQHKCEQYQKLKASLLQQMFI